MNSFILTGAGAALVINGRPYTIDKSHPNFESVLDLIRAKDWQFIPELINISLSLVKFANGKVLVDPDAGVVLYGGREVHNVLVNHMLTMMGNGFDIEPMAQFLANLYQNPNAETIEALYGWMQHNNVTITEDGCLVAYKRVRDDYKSFHDGSTVHAIGFETSIPRDMCDQNNRNTCSAGLHFCSHAYLPNYHGGQGRVLILKINPRDVTAIPNDYNFAKGRACAYTVIGELEGEARTRIEQEEVLDTPVLTAQTNANATEAFRLGYEAGYKDGRGKKATGTSYSADYAEGGRFDKTAAADEYSAGYDTGRSDGRLKKPKLYGMAPVAEEAVSRHAPRVQQVIGEMLGLDASDVGLDKTFHGDLGTDSLDDVELVMALEDEFNIEITDEDAEKCTTVRDAVNLVDNLLSGRS